MKLPDTRVIVFNVAAGVVTIAALLGVLRSFVIKPSSAPCTERYPAGNIFALERGGVLLTATDLQARLAGKDIGLSDNVEIAKLKGAPTSAVMGVKLAKGAASPLAPTPVKGGVSFPWDPRAVQGKVAACLAYSVLLPADFDFHRGGVLPGIHGAAEADAAADSFAAQIAWRRNARGGVLSRVAVAGEVRQGNADPEPFIFPTGRWVKLEQEVLLNTPGKFDGTVRVWLDGRLAVERTNMLYRGRPGATTSDVTITGVAADVFYGTDDAATAAPKDTTVWLSPFEIRWQ